MEPARRLALYGLSLVGLTTAVIYTITRPSHEIPMGIVAAAGVCLMLAIMNRPRN